MTGTRNPMRDRVAIAGAATTGFHPRNTDRSQASYVAQACQAVLDQCGLTPRDIDGLCGSLPAAPAVQSMLGIPEVTWFANPMIPFGNHLAAAASAVYSGLCDVVLAYHGAYRMAWNTGSALKDPFRRGVEFGSAGTVAPESVAGSVGYTAWASRYLMEDYLSARMIRSPLCLYDMDVPVDGADAFIITTAERARDLRQHGQQVTVEALRAKSDFWIDDIDVFLPSTGSRSSPSTGSRTWATAGRARPDRSSRTTGWPTRGLATGRQVEGAERALVNIGGFFFNAQGITLRRG
jgi:hypothetical protein